jgi:ATP-dependent helicase HrpB
MDTKVTSLLPIYEHIGPITDLLERHTTLILQAPPGTGKTTVLPLALLNAPWMAGKRCLMLQPRRLAAKSVATRMSEMLGEPVGKTVGYQMRLERVASAATRLEIITEGILAKRIISDPELKGVGAIIFDEFHERSIHADIGLALAREIAETFRPDLRLVVMSATLSDASVLDNLSGAARYEFSGTTFPVTVRYMPGESRLPIWDRVAAATLSALNQHEGDALVFLPGLYEIQRTEALLTQSRMNGTVILPLYGDLSPTEQERAMLPDTSGRRKVVLSTNIAETSVTIEGVRIIIDSGLHKVSRSDSIGTMSLKTERISRDSSDQRAGRAGRTAPGVCIRLWSEQEHQALRPFREPEVLRVDLAPALLDLAAWGVTKPAEFSWITKPSQVAIAAAQSLLLTVGAVSGGGAITSEGRQLAELGTHPVLGKLALSARALGLEAVAARLLAIIEERDVVDSGADIAKRLALIEGARSSNPRLQRIHALAERWLRRIEKIPRNQRVTSDRDLLTDDNHVGFLLAQAFPLSVAKRRGANSPRYLVASGQGATLKEGDPLAASEYLVVIEQKEGVGDAKIGLAARLDSRLFEGPLRSLVSDELAVSFDDHRGALVASKRRMLGTVVISEQPNQQLEPEQELEGLLSWLKTKEGFSRLPFSEEVTRLRQRVLFAQCALGCEGFPELSDAELMRGVDLWLQPFLRAPYRLRSITTSIVSEAVLALLTYPQQRELASVAPESYKLPSGKVRHLDYSQPNEVILAATIQELFGVAEAPRLGKTQVPMTVHLLSPARRPVQVTKDLASFWRNSYPEVRKELRGRYPKHRWPEDPLHLEG